MTFDTTTLILIVGLTASIVHILHLTFPANKTVTKIDDLGEQIIDELHRLFPQVTIPPLMSQATPQALPPSTVLTAAAKVAPMLLIALMLAGCGATARQQTLSAAVATVTASETALETYNHKHELDVAGDQSLTTEQRHEKLIAYRATRDKVEFAVDLAWRALGIAGPLNDDTSLVNVKLAVSQVVSIVTTLIGGGKL